jgi:hypothetical protein
MGYNIEVSFNTLKHSCVMETRDMIINLALENGCESYYDTIEFINDQFETRNHNVITINFKENNIDQIVKFLKLVKDIRGMYIETIYDDLTEQLLFASKYYLTHTIDKYLVNKPKLNRRERSYSEDDTIIINTMQQKTKKR